MKMAVSPCLFCSCLNYSIDESGINGSGGIDESGIEHGGTDGINGSCIIGRFIDVSSIDGINGGRIDAEDCHYVQRGDG